MASIKRNYNKNGKLISFRIRVYRGHDQNGSEMTKFSKTVKVPEKLSPTKIEKFIAQESILFEEECKSGYVNVGKMTFNEFADIALAEMAFEGIKRSTIDGYEDHLKRLKDEFGHMKLDAIQPEHLERFYTRLKQVGSNKKDPSKGLSTKTIREHHNTMSSIMRRAYNKKYIKENPCKRVTPPKVPKPKVNYYQPDDLQKIIECLRQEKIKWKTLVMLLIATGGRRGETLGLTWDCIDIENSIIQINKNVQYSPKVGIYIDTPKTEKSNRSIKVPSIIIDGIVTYKESKVSEYEKLNVKIAETDFIFTQEVKGQSLEKCSSIPMHPDSVNDYLRKFAKKYDLPNCNPHAFRHTISTILISEGFSSVELAEYLGNSVYHVENIYSHIIEAKKAKMATTIADTLFK